MQRTYGGTYRDVASQPRSSDDEAFIPFFLLPSLLPNGKAFGELPN